jgi:hypothetical protein
VTSLQAYRDSVESQRFSVDDTVLAYLAWVKISFWVIVVGWNESTQRFEYGAFRSAKRGDPKYAMQTKSRFYGLFRSLPSEDFFSWGDRGRVSSPLLFVTHTVDPSRISLAGSWLDVGSEFNRWISLLRSKFGKISVVRTWDSHESGFCHVHALLMFHDRSFDGYLHHGRKGKTTYRLSNRSELATIKAGWKAGFSDVQMCSSVSSAGRYLGKYLTKCVDHAKTDSKGVKTLALAWYFGKRSFSISGDFIDAYHDLIQASDNSNRVGLQLRLSGSPIHVGVVEWRLFGFYLGDRIGWKALFLNRIAAQAVSEIVSSEGFVPIQS